MGKLSRVLALAVGISFILGLPMAHAFSSATHLYIAQHAFGVQNTDLFYGSIAPDIALYTDPDKWPTAFGDTHYDYVDLKRYAVFPVQKAFAKGWLTHNELWGADYYAHILNPLGNNVCATTSPNGYVIEKACLLSQGTGIDSGFAHLVVEIAIDLLLRNNLDPKLGEKLMNASSSRSLLDRTLLATALVWNWRDQRTDWFTLASTELTFRGVVDLYAAPLKLPSPYNEQALAKLGARLAEAYGMDVSEEEVLAILEAAIVLCEDDYEYLVEYVISAIKGNLGL